MSKRGRKDPLNEVVVVLNDLQPTKVQLADTLAERLRARRIPCSVVPTATELARTIELRQPAILVLDYLLGETMTALDLIEQFRIANTLPQTQIVLWTDEPSIRVAVDSIRAGARDFIEMNDGRHLSRLVATIERLRATQSPASRSAGVEGLARRAVQPISLGLRQSYRYAESLLTAHHPILVLLGERGSGRSSLARHLHDRRPNGRGRKVGVFTEIEFDLWPHDLSRILGTTDGVGRPHLLSHGATVMIDHAEFDSGELVAAVAERLPALFQVENAPLLVVGTASEEVARGWSRLTDAAVIELPAFADRRDDVQAAIAELAPTADPDLFNWIMKEHWPGSFRQLTVALQELDYCGIGQQEALKLAKHRWERFALASTEIPSLEQARRVLATTDGDIRLAAAQLGVGIAQIRAAIHLPLTERTDHG